MNEDVYGLTNPQKAIWLTEQVYQRIPISNVCGIMRINEVISFDLLEKSLNNVIKNHEGIRLRIKLSDEGVPIQYIKEYHCFNIPVVPSNKEEIDHYIDTVASKPFNIIENDLFHFELFRFSDDTGGIIALFHHLISDAWSMDLLTSLVADEYYRLKNNLQENVSSSYVEYILQEKKYIASDRFEKDKIFWEEAFCHFSEISSFNVLGKEKKSTNAKRISFELGEENTKLIHSFCGENKISPYTLMISLISIYLSKISNKTNIVVGTPILNRSNFKEKNTLGMFIETMPFITDVDINTTFIHFLQNTSKLQLSYFKHQKYPYDAILSDIRKKYNITTNLYDVLISYQNAKNNSKDSQINYSCEWRFNKHITESMNIHIFDINDTGNLTFAYDYLIDIFSEKEIYLLHDRILDMVFQVIKNPTITLKDLEILSNLEKQKIVYDFNNTFVPYPKEKSVHELFEQQVLENPDDIALICSEKSITYNELNEKSNSLATFLREKGITNNSIIGIMVNRSLEMIIGILGILKAGAAYLPIDPEYPLDRITYMLEDSNANFLLVDKKSISLLPGSYIKVDISLESHIYTTYSTKNLNLQINSEQLMYLIYTSRIYWKAKRSYVDT